MASNREIRAFDLFCGGGGSSLGAKQAGACPVGGVDVWQLATDAFKLNLPGTSTYTQNLDSLKPRQVAKDVGPIDLLLASPECTHHSVARGKSPQSEESKALAYHVIRFAKAMRPRWVVVENVIQMQAWPMFQDWLAELHDLGYHTSVSKRDAEDFGVPQNRRRLFVTCDLKKPPVEPRTYRRRNATVDWVLKTAKIDEWSGVFSPVNNGRRAANTLERARRAIRAVGAHKPFIMVYYGSDGAGGFQTLDRPLRTITTLDRFAIVQPNCVGHEMRMLQPSELALAMGFPRKYRWPETASRRDCIKLIGNAVCPPVMKAIVRALLKPAPAVKRLH
jgi:DNA (cytosine-5)-methyltransferase 1